MNWKSETLGDWKKRHQEWHDWFPVIPVFSVEDRKTYWLETVQRRLKEYNSYSDTAHWEYKGK